MSHGGNICTFTALALADIPDAWKQPPTLAWLAEMAAQLGVAPSVVVATVVLVVPQTALGIEYMQWHQMPTRHESGAVPAMLVNLGDFVNDHGAQRLREFNESMASLGRPCHFARVIGSVRT